MKAISLRVSFGAVVVGVVVVEVGVGGVAKAGAAWS
jgi:hypothetical protein